MCKKFQPNPVMSREFKELHLHWLHGDLAHRNEAGPNHHVNVIDEFVFMVVLIFTFCFFEKKCPHGSDT